MKAMSVKTLHRTIVTLLVAAVVSVSAQTPPAQPRKEPRQARFSQPHPVAPQVVTIIHRLNGLKMFRLLRRSDEQVRAIASLDEAFNLTDDVHTNIIAGLALDDGRTIAVWLPDADLEFGPSVFLPRPPRAPLPAAKPGNDFDVEKFVFKGGMSGSPDLTVIGPDGQRLAAEYVGLDGATGLSILRLSDTNLNISSDIHVHAISEGESVRLINPEPAPTAQVNPMGNVFVRMGTTSGTVLSVRRAPVGDGLVRFKIRSARLSLTNIGGVALNESGETVGIVNAVEGPEATILPTAVVQRAAKRVLARHASVPRPWLGVKGEPLARVNVEQFKNWGWKGDRANWLVERHLGILLTSIAPGSPAAFAAFRPGDVILKVNDKDVESGDDFSWLLDQAGPSSSVTFTLARPDRLSEEAVKVELSGLLNPESANGFSNLPPSGSLISQGVETVALRPMVASQLNASPGLLVVYVDPSSVAFEAGLRPADVIESIDGKPIPVGANNFFPGTVPGAKSSFEIVRKKQKVVITVRAPEKND